MIKTGTGISTNSDPFQAGTEAAKEAIGELGEKPHLLLVTASNDFNAEKVLFGIKSVSPETPMAGGTPGWGAITNRGVVDKGVVVMALSFEKIKVGVDYLEKVAEDSFKAGMTLAEKLMKKDTPPKLILIFLSTVQGESMDLVIQGLKKKVKDKTNIIGGGTGDEMVLKSSGYQFCNGKALNGSIVGVGFWGDFSMSLKAEHGWEALGLPMKVTKSRGNFVSEIDDRPAIEVFEKYFPKEEVRDPKFFTGEGRGFPYPLGIMAEKPERIIVRQIIGLAPEGELITVCNIPEGTMVRLMQIQPERIIEVAEEVGKGIISQLKKGKPQLALIFDCVTRRLLSTPEHQKGVNVFMRAMGEEISRFGYFSYGELCSTKEEKDWLSHNETFTTAVLAE